MSHPTAHQKIIKEKTRQEDLERYGADIFINSIDEYVLNKEPISEEIKKFVERYEWLGGVGVLPRWIFTARLRGVLACVVCMNLPNSFSKLLGPDTRKYECLIQRGASTSFCHPHMGSRLIRWACRWMVQNTEKRLFLGYADSTAGERGIIYRASGFDYLGSDFGTSIMLVHPDFNKGKPFTPQSLRRTSVWKRLYKQWYGVPLPKEFLSDNGFKNIAKVRSLPGGTEAVEEFYAWGNKIVAESVKTKIPSKGKYALVLGKDRREQRVLNKMKSYKPKPYPS